MSDDVKKCAVLAVIGAPNAGKSTLVNALVGAKVSIVTRKVQTTRARVRGIAVDGQSQLVFVDTPGIFNPEGKSKSRKLDRAMVAAAWDGVTGADKAILMIDAPAYLAGDTDKGAASYARADTDRIIAGLKKSRSQVVIALNKIDEIAHQALLPLVKEMDAQDVAREIFLISAVNGDGMQKLKEYLIETAPVGPWLYPDDQLSDISDRLMAAEVTREKLFLRLHQELPYDLTVETDQWKETNSGIRIEQTIYVARSGQKGIVLGKNGQTLKAIGQLAREELSELMGVPTHLFLFVKVREGWADESARLRLIGLDA